MANEWGDEEIALATNQKPAARVVNEWGDVAEPAETLAVNEWGDMPEDSYGTFAAARPVGLLSRAGTAVRESAPVAAVLGPTKNQQLRRGAEQQALARDLPAVAAALAPSPVTEKNPQSDWTDARNAAARGALDQGVGGMTEGMARAADLYGRAAITLYEGSDEGLTRAAVGQDPAARVAEVRARTAALAPGNESLFRQAGGKVAEFRGAVREVYPVDEGFSRSTLGQVVFGVGQAPAYAAAFMTGLGIPAVYGQVFDAGYQDARSSGADEDTALVAAVANLPAGALEYASNRLMLGPALKAFKGATPEVQRTLARRITQTMKAGAGEAVTEGAQQLVTNTAAKALYDKERPLTEGVGQSMVVGGLVGTTVAAGGEGAASLAEKANLRTLPEGTTVEYIGKRSVALEGAGAPVAQWQIKLPGEDGRGRTLTAEQLAVEGWRPPSIKAGPQWADGSTQIGRATLPEGVRSFADRPAEVLQILVGLYREAVGSPPAAKRGVVYSLVDDAAAAAMAEQAGVDVRGYRHTVDNYALRHVAEAHGQAATESLRGQLPITADDIARIPEITRPENLKEVKRNERGQHVLVYELGISGTLIAAEEVRVGRGELALASLYKRKAQGSTSANPSPEGAGLRTLLTTEGTPAPTANKARVIAPVNTGPRAEVVLQGEKVSVPVENLPGAIQAMLDPVLPATDPGPVVQTESKPLGLLESAKRSPEIAPLLQQQLEGYYETQSNASSIQEANRLIDQAGDLDAAKMVLLSEQSPDAVTNAMGLELVRKFQADGRLADAADVLHDMAQKAKTQGQAIQILSTLSRSTPEGMAVIAQRILGRKLTPAELAEIKRDVDRVQAAKDPAVKLARQSMLLGKLQGKLPVTWDEKLAAAVNLSMLLNPKTQIRNVGGNTIQMVGDMAADVIATPVDWGVSVFTGSRTVHGPQIKTWLSGLATPGKEAAAAWRQARRDGAGLLAAAKETVDTIHALTKLGDTSKLEIGDVKRGYRLVFSSPLMRGLEKTLGLVMGVPDRAFYMARLQASLRSQMTAAKAVVPTAEMVDRASLEAARSTYQDRNVISQSLAGVRKELNRASTFGFSTRFGAGTAIVPFTQVPGALAMRGLEFSPVGFVRAASELLIPVFTKNRVFNQREFSQAFGKALTGTIGLTVAGYWMHQLGIITGGPNPDDKVRRLERDLGFGGYKLNVSEIKRRLQSMDWKSRYSGVPRHGDVLINYDWVQPMAFPAAVGADISETQKQRDLAKVRGQTGASQPGRVLSALASGARTLEEQPLLTGLSGFMSDAAAASRGDGAGALEALWGSMLRLPSQFVPSGVRQMTQLMDNRIYQTRGSDRLETAYQSVAANIPGVAESLGFKPRSDILGGMAQRYQANGNSYFNVLINPAMVTRFRDDPELREIYRVWQVTGETGQLPSEARQSITVNGAPRTLTSPERADYSQFVGRITRDAFRQLMSAESYQDATDEQRAKVLTKVVSSAGTAGKVLLFGDRPKALDKWDRALLGTAMKNAQAKEMIRTGP